MILDLTAGGKTPEQRIRILEEKVAQLIQANNYSAVAIAEILSMLTEGSEHDTENN